MAVFSNKPGEYQTSFGTLVVPASGLVYTPDESLTGELENLGFTVTSSQEKLSEPAKPEETKAGKSDKDANPPLPFPSPIENSGSIYPRTVEAESGPRVKGK